MSIFEDNIKKPIIPDPIKKPTTNLYGETLFCRISGLDFFIDEEEEALRGFYSKTFVKGNGAGLFQLLPLITDRNGTEVMISEEVKKIVTYDHPVNIYKSLLLGEYMKSKDDQERDRIILYINSIRSAVTQFNGWLKNNKEYSWPESTSNIKQAAIILLDVFAHELYHAYFHSDTVKNLKKYEEPLAELGGLHYLNNYYNNDGDRKILSPLYAFVKSKELEEYSLGADLFTDNHYDLIDKYKDNTLQQEAMNIIDQKRIR